MAIERYVSIGEIDARIIFSTRQVRIPRERDSNSFSSFRRFSFLFFSFSLSSTFRKETIVHIIRDIYASTQRYGTIRHKEFPRYEFNMSRSRNDS